jgi:putative phosphoribosyl transferase
MTASAALFANRRAAGRQLVQALMGYAAQHPVVLALPRGGVPVAFEVAEALDAPLDLIFVRKIGAPGHPEYGIGAIVDGSDPQLVINPAAGELGISRAFIEAQANREFAEIERRRKIYAGDRKPLPIRDRLVILVDDGIATGGTVRAALQGLRKAGSGTRSWRYPWRLRIRSRRCAAKRPKSSASPRRSRSMRSAAAFRTSPRPTTRRSSRCSIRRAAGHWRRRADENFRSDDCQSADNCAG